MRLRVSYENIFGTKYYGNRIKGDLGIESIAMEI